MNGILKSQIENFLNVAFFFFISRPLLGFSSRLSVFVFILYSFADNNLFSRSPSIFVNLSLMLAISLYKMDDTTEGDNKMKMKIDAAIVGVEPNQPNTPFQMYESR